MRHAKAQPPTEAEKLEAALSKLVDAAMAGDHDSAVLALSDAIAFGLAGARLAAEVWAAQQHLAAADLDDDQSGHPT